MTSPTYSTYSLPCSRIRPVPSSSTFRYGFSIDYTDPFLSGQQFYPAWASCPNPRTHSRSLLAKEDAGLMVPPSACAPSACTAMRPVCMPTPQGSNAPVRRVEEGCHLAPLKLPTCNEHELSLGGHALEDRQTRVQAYLEDLPGSALTPKPHLECCAPSHSHSTHRGYAPAGTDPYSQSMVCNRTNTWRS